MIFTAHRHLSITDATHQRTFPALLLYPSQQASRTTMIGPYAFDSSPDAPIAPGRFPLILISHGSGGSHLLYRSIAIHLARHGYVVALPEHPGNNRNDNSLESSNHNLALRPYHLGLTIAAVAETLGASVNTDQIGIIGHSMGGYTALALAGGQPRSQAGEVISVQADSRVKSLVLLAPATPWYRHPDALRQVSQPILLLSAQQDDITPLWHADIVLDGVANRNQIQHQIVPYAGHFSFLSPFPVQMHTPGFRPAFDPYGFDREQFHAVLPQQIAAFLDQTIQR